MGYVEERLWWPIQSPNIGGLKLTYTSFVSCVTVLGLRTGLALACLNINSIRNRFELLTPIILDSVDILVIAETKFDSNFATNHFVTDGLNPFYRYDRDGNGGDLLIYVREGIPVKELTDLKAPDEIECGILEVDMHKKKLILFGIYRPSSQNVDYFFDEMGKIIDPHSNRCENFIALGDFNIEEK